MRQPFPMVWRSDRDQGFGALLHGLVTQIGNSVFRNDNDAIRTRIDTGTPLRRAVTMRVSPFLVVEGSATMARPPGAMFAPRTKSPTPPMPLTGCWPTTSELT